jgi:hypothetical protein
MFEIGPHLRDAIIALGAAFAFATAIRKLF